MQAHFNPNAAADSCVVLAESWANGVVEMWFVVCATAPLLVEHQRPKHNHRWVEAFYVIVLESDSGLEASDSDNFGSLFAKVSPWRLFASRICTRLEVATWCCRTQHIADCWAYSQKQIALPKFSTNDCIAVSQIVALPIRVSLSDETFDRVSFWTWRGFSDLQAHCNNSVPIFCFQVAAPIDKA